jgi:hypothetical protein
MRKPALLAAALCVLALPLAPAPARAAGGAGVAAPTCSSGCTTPTGSPRTVPQPEPSGQPAIPAISVPGLGSFGGVSGGGSGGPSVSASVAITPGTVHTAPGGRLQSYVNIPTCGWLSDTNPALGTTRWGGGGGTVTESQGFGDGSTWVFTVGYTYTVSVTGTQDDWDWGDGSSTTLTSGDTQPIAYPGPQLVSGSWQYGSNCNAHHIYKKVGAYTVKVTRHFSVTVTLTCAGFGSCPSSAGGGTPTRTARSTNVYVWQIEGSAFERFPGIIGPQTPGDAFNLCNLAYPRPRDNAFAYCMWLEDSNDWSNRSRFVSGDVFTGDGWYFCDRRYPISIDPTSSGFNSCLAALGLPTVSFGDGGADDS